MCSQGKKNLMPQKYERLVGMQHHCLLLYPKSKQPRWVQPLVEEKYQQGRQSTGIWADTYFPPEKAEPKTITVCVHSPHFRLHAQVSTLLSTFSKSVWLKIIVLLTTTTSSSYFSFHALNLRMLILQQWCKIVRYRDLLHSFNHAACFISQVQSNEEMIKKQRELKCRLRLVAIYGCLY